MGNFYDLFFSWNHGSSDTAMGYLTLAYAYAGDENGKGAWAPGNVWRWEPGFVGSGYRGELIARAPKMWLEPQRGGWLWMPGGDVLLGAGMLGTGKAVATMKAIPRDRIWSYIKELKAVSNIRSRLRNPFHRDPVSDQEKMRVEYFVEMQGWGMFADKTDFNWTMRFPSPSL